MNAIVLTSLSLVFLFLRILPYLLNKNIKLVDHYFHLIYAEEIRNNCFRFPKYIRKFLIQKDALSYPFLYHYFLSLFKTNQREKISHFLVLVFDILQTIIIFVLSKILTDQHQFSPLTPYISVFIFASSTIFFRVGDSRNIGASARPLGELFFTATFILEYLFIEGNGGLFLALACVFASLILLTSKFAVQSFLFCSLILGIFYSPIFLLVVFGGLIIAVIFTKGNYSRTLEGHLSHSNYQRLISHTASFSLQELILTLKKYKLSEFKLIIEKIYKTPLVMIFLLSPLNLIMIYNLLVNYSAIEDHLLFFYYWTLTSLLICILVSFKKFKFLGEADRYGDYSIPAIAIAIPIILNSTGGSVSNMLIYFLLLFSTLFSLYSVIVWIKAYPTNSNVAMVINYLNKIENSNVGTIPVSLCYEIGYKTNHRFLFHGASFSDRFANLPKDKITNDFIYSKFPLLNFDLFSLTNKFKLDYFVIQKEYSYMSIYNKQRLLERYDFSFCESVFENEEFVVFKVLHP